MHLTPIEFSILLDASCRKPGAVWTHRQLLAAVWGTTAGVTNDTLRVHMGGLRRKLEDDPNRPALDPDRALGRLPVLARSLNAPPDLPEFFRPSSGLLSGAGGILRP